MIEPESPRQTLIAYGNCQAEAIAVVLEKIPALRERFRIIYLRSFDHPVEGFGDLSAAEVEACGVLVEQHDLRVFPYEAQLPSHCIRLKFPSVDLNLLWPFTRTNPYNDPESKEYPYGRFPYGDDTIIRCIDKDMSADDTLAYYLTGWDDYKPDLDRLFALDRARLAARDARCQVKIGDFAIDSFRSNRLFWSINHPSVPLLQELVARLLNAAFPNEPHRPENIGQLISTCFGKRGPLGIVSIPVHPRVAEHFELTWYDPRELYPSFDGKSYSYSEYFKAMIDASIARKTLVQSA